MQNVKVLESCLFVRSRVFLKIQYFFENSSVNVHTHEMYIKVRKSYKFTRNEKNTICTMKLELFQCGGFAVQYIQQYQQHRGRATQD